VDVFLSAIFRLSPKVSPAKSLLLRPNQPGGGDGGGENNFSLRFAAVTMQGAMQLLSCFL
jgi:hypothetical protein